MEKYNARNITFKELVELDGWKVKIYTIAQVGDQIDDGFYQQVKEQLPAWLKSDNGFERSHYNVAFLIIHAGSEGIFSLINWWLGGYMINTNIYLTTPENSTDFNKISGHGLGPCVWELAVINHERIAWTENVLKKFPNPDFESYLAAVIDVQL